MGIMSEIDIMVHEGAQTAEDFAAYGYDRETAEAMETVVEESLTVCPNCEQWQRPFIDRHGERNRDCLNQCRKRGFAS